MRGQLNLNGPGVICWLTVHARCHGTKQGSDFEERNDRDINPFCGQDIEHLADRH